jgi:hypothetical protein
MVSAGENPTDPVAVQEIDPENLTGESAPAEPWLAIETTAEMTAATTTTRPNRMSNMTPPFRMFQLAR